MYIKYVTEHCIYLSNTLVTGTISIYTQARSAMYRTVIISTTFINEKFDTKIIIVWHHISLKY